ncbi:MAG TPA: Mur ligase domain-containing protein [Candidatus Saccharimonadales bacterium]|nr:Mur ligase domain-containing protein [Candidatus Saccharimonadales bacterium]
MHIFFSGIGGTAIGPLALIAKQAGFTVSGSDKQDSQYIAYLRAHGITDIHIGQTTENIAAVHARQPIDWFVYSSAVAMENPHAPELLFCREQDIKMSKRDELLNLILQEKKLKLIAVAGTHGKSTTTAMAIWLFKQIGVPVSYSVGAKLSYGDMGHYEAGSEYFVYEADEFDRNFLAFEPHTSIITGVTWDHHEIFPTREDYQAAFREFIGQSQHTVLWQEDFAYLGLATAPQLAVQKSDDPRVTTIELKGLYNRLDAWLVIAAVYQLTGASFDELTKHMRGFPGLQRRMEQIIPNLYSDYAHTPEKIRGAMSVALEMAADKGQDLVVAYEPLTNRRQHYMLNEYKDCFAGAKKVYWIPSYLAREDPNQMILTPAELITHLDDSSFAVASERGQGLKKAIQKHLDGGDMVVCMAGGGGDSLDEWVRKEFAHAKT